jgi:hypothetical protein
MKTLAQDPIGEAAGWECSTRKNAALSRSREGREESLKSKTCLLYREMKDWYRGADRSAAKQS